MNADFTRRMSLRRPYVILKTALSLDGRAFAAGGASQWITGPAARRLSRSLRAKADAILVGINTVLKDDPSLTAGGGGKNPLRVVLDTRLRTPKNARCADGAAPTVIFTASTRRHPRAETVRVPRAAGKIALGPVLENLLHRGIRSMIVEGGPSVHASFLAAGAVDEARVFIAPKLISGARTPAGAPRLRSPRLRRIGEARERLAQRLALEGGAERAEAGLGPEMGDRGLVQAEIIGARRETPDPRRQEQGFGIGVGLVRGRDPQYPPGQALDEQRQHVLHRLEVYQAGCGSGLGGVGRDVVERRATRVETLTVVHVHGLDQPALDQRRVHEPEGLGNVRSELIGHLGVGLGDDLHPLQGELLLGATELGKRTRQRRRRAARGQHRIERLVEAGLELGGG